MSQSPSKPQRDHASSADGEADTRDVPDMTQPTTVGIGEGAALLSRLLRPYWARVVVGLVLLIFGITLESIALISFGILFGLVSTEGGVAAEPEGIFSAIKWVYDSLDIGYTATTVILGIALLFLVKGITAILAEIAFLSVNTDIERDTRVRLAKKLLHAEWSYVHRQRLGDLLNILISQTARTASTALQAMKVVSLSGTVVVYILFALLVSPLATIMLAATVAATGVVTWFTFRAMSRLGYRSIVVGGTLNHQVNEIISGFVVLKSIGAESGALTRLTSQTQALKRVAMRIGILRSSLNTALEPGIVVALITVVILEATTSFDFAALGVVGLILFRTFQRIYAVSVSVGTLGDGVASIATVENLEDVLSLNREQSKGTDIADFEGMEFRGVSVSYGDGKLALRDVDLQVKKGEFIGIVGQSGAGKSTLASLIMGLMKPDDGTILINGSDLDGLNERSWREHIGFVPQETFLFNDTVEENIRVWRPWVDDASVARAVRISQSSGFIENMSDGLKSQLGDRGAGLSGGERQRLALARAIAANPKILLLDEATSSLDAESERSFQDALRELRGDVTILAIAHRLSTVVEADRIVVLENGAITEEGTPADLLKLKNGRFAELYRLQSISPDDATSMTPAADNDDQPPTRPPEST